MRGLAMSRSLGRRARYKEIDAQHSPQGQGAKAFKEGKPRTDCPYSSDGLGKGHAWKRGWDRAHQEARNKKK